MYRYLLPAIVVLFWGSQVQAQQFFGRGSFSLESQGTQSSTQLLSQQVAGKYDASKQEIHFYFKSLSFAFQEDQATREMISECFLSQGYPVVDLKIQEVDMEELSKGKVQAQANLRLMGHDFKFPIFLTSSTEENGLSLSGTFTIDLQSKQIQLPQAYMDRMGNRLTFQFDQFQLIRR